MKRSPHAARLVAMLLSATSAGCVARPRMCSAPSDCAPASGACVAGRCQAEPPARVVVGEPETRRLVFAPVDLAYVRRGETRPSGSPRIGRLGSERDGEAEILLRFDVPSAALSRVAEAYVILKRSDAFDTDPSPAADPSSAAVALHASRIVESWDGPSVTWARKPRVDDVRGPSSPVPDGRARMRVDVRDLVRRWRRHDPRDQGIAIVAERTSTSGAVFTLLPVEAALMPLAVRPLTASAVRSASPPPFFAGAEPEGSSSSLDGLESGPVLEIYVK